MTSYAAFVSSHPSLYFAHKDGAKVIFEEAKIAAFQKETGEALGVLFEDPRIFIVRDLLEASDGSFYGYIRIVPKETGAVAILPMVGDKFILLKHYRFPPNRSFYEIPRGDGAKGFSLVKNAFKELNEETSLDVVSMQPLGSVYPDTGLYASEVGVYLALCSSKKKPELLDKGEAIHGYVFLSGGELEAAIAQGKIQDAFTIMAFALYQAKKASE